MTIGIGKTIEVAKDIPEVLTYHGVEVNIENGNLVFHCKDIEQIVDILKSLDDKVPDHVIWKLLSDRKETL